MVLFVMKWDILPDKIEAYKEWTSSATKRLISAPGVIEFRGYRPSTGSHQVVVTYEFADFPSWAAWVENEDVRKVKDEMQALTCNRSTELWGPSPVVPEPIRPGK